MPPSPIVKGELPLIDYTCPRCGEAARDRFVGPCPVCRSQLRRLGGPARDVEAEAYEPKMNVTPNAVATKD